MGDGPVKPVLVSMVSSLPSPGSFLLCGQRAEQWLYCRRKVLTFESPCGICGRNVLQECLFSEKAGLAMGPSQQPPMAPLIVWSYPWQTQGSPVGRGHIHMTGRRHSLERVIQSSSVTFRGTRKHFFPHMFFVFFKRRTFFPNSDVLSFSDSLHAGRENAMKLGEA